MTARIVIDAMGGDHAPHEVVAGALLAERSLGCELILVGREAAIRRELQSAAAGSRSASGKAGTRLRIVDAPDVIEMEEHATEAVRGRQDSSIKVGLELVKRGEADAFVTAGNTGAAMASALLTLGRVRGIARPALAVIFPTASGRTMFLDVGANADCRPAHLVQFAHMGAAYVERMFRLTRPKVALLSIGEEDSKGNQLVIEVNEELRRSALNFVGNIEGREITSGAADVIVMDGFTGNVVLKTAEGVSELLFNEVRKAVNLSPWNRLAGMVLYSELRKVRRRIDYAEYGGAQLLGVDGVTVIGHGRSNARAVCNAIRAARDAVDAGVLDVLRAVAEEVPARRKNATDSP